MAKDWVFPSMSPSLGFAVTRKERRDWSMLLSPPSFTHLYRRSPRGPGSLTAAGATAGLSWIGAELGIPTRTMGRPCSAWLFRAASYFATRSVPQIRQTLTDNAGPTATRSAR